MRRLNPPVLRRQPEVQERQRLQRVEQQVVVQLEPGLLEPGLLEQQELVRPQEPPVLRELLQAPYQLWAQPSQALA
jgi:hypothetical protein